MKKYVILILSTTFIIGFLLSYLMISETFIPYIETTVIEPTNIKTTVVCDGIVEEVGASNIQLDTPVYPKDIKVNIGDEIEKGDLLFTIDTVTTAAALNYYAESQTASGTYGGLSSDKQANAAIPAEVYAPVSGTVTQMAIEEGKMTTLGDDLITISKKNGYQVRVKIDENNISDITVGQKAVITGNGFKEQTYSGTVSMIYPTAKQVTTSYGLQTVVEALVSIDNSDGNIRAGYTAKVSIVTDVGTDVLVVPYEAVGQDSNDQQYVYILKNGWAYKRDFEGEREVESGIEVRNLLAPGDILVLNPESLLEEGDTVKVKLTEKSSLSTSYGSNE